MSRAGVVSRVSATSRVSRVSLASRASVVSNVSVRSPASSGSGTRSPVREPHDESTRAQRSVDADVVARKRKRRCTGPHGYRAGTAAQGTVRGESAARRAVLRAHTTQMGVGANIPEEVFRIRACAPRRRRAVLRRPRKARGRRSSRRRTSSGALRTPPVTPESSPRRPEIRRAALEIGDLTRRGLISGSVCELSRVAGGSRRRRGEVRSDKCGK
jgi:hypothetical protein